jgi:hypothetical protein
VPVLERRAPAPVPVSLQARSDVTGAAEFRYVGLAVTMVPLAFNVHMSAACRTSMPFLLR